MLVCSKCGHEMVILILNDTEIDYCLNCGSIWLDKGELDFIINRRLDGEKIENTLLQKPSKEYLKKEKKKKCPVCLRRMEKKFFSANSSNIVLDVCEKHGIWFDQGELYAIVKNEKNEDSLNVVDFLKDLFNAKYKGA